MLTACVLGAIVALQWSYLLRVGLWSFIDPRSSRFMDNEAARLAQLAPPRRLAHTWVDYQRISVHLKRAVIAAEDARFVDHAGFDWEAIRKAFTANFYRGSHPRGGSTITQQLAKNLFLTPERSYLRKAQEAVITAMIEALWSKRRILEVYLNLVEWGDGIFGAEAAARHYGGITAAQLGPEQAARMAALLPRPRFFDRHPGVPFIAERTADIARTMPFARIP